MKKNQTERETMGPHVSGKNGGRKDFIYREITHLYKGRKESEGRKIDR